ncbi:uncharacterized protein LOC110429569 isoform X1 [Sorghum bicolor]|uniref:uncharacterized protein LOC110429569 isoform X1 n=1 Tax=Sorghum bicolor TaxID=4558 RepID=UPI000B424709|nr:uncharacterized protein LOC110429569 isoform X1 [Sorghum bicolor]|eukprot:XP_021301344.1 uncharacterized protein LOC110429569 isoform X1 [Sorghum bicolor]
MAVVLTFDFGTAAWAMYPTLRKETPLPRKSVHRTFSYIMSLFCSLNFPVCLGELPIHNQAIHEAQKPYHRQPRGRWCWSLQFSRKTDSFLVQAGDPEVPP